MMRMLVETRPPSRVPPIHAARRRAEQRARRWVLRELDRLGEERRSLKEEQH
jgi:hypothetical protein